MMKTMFGGPDSVCPKLFLMPEASATVPSAAQRNRGRGVTSFVCGNVVSSQRARVRSGRDYHRQLPAQVQPHAEHRAARIQEHGGLPEARAEQVVGGDALLGLVVERIEQIKEEFDAAQAAD